jgi:hypothetical protein
LWFIRAEEQFLANVESLDRHLPVDRPAELPVALDKEELRVVPFATLPQPHEGLDPRILE